MSKPVRFILALVVALLTWAVVATLINFVLRAAIPGYHAEELALSSTPTSGFSLTSEIARLGMSLVATAVAAIVAVWLSRGAVATAVVTGLILLAMFIPIHHKLWWHFPVWYHLFFLVSLPMVSYAVAKWWTCRRRPA